MRKLVVVVAVLAGVMPVAHAASVSVSVRDNRFEPGNVKANVGQAVVWAASAANGDVHNVREDKKIFFSGPAEDPDFTYKRVFSAGTFHYFCDRHGFPSGGMDGTVKVPVKLVTSPAGPQFTVVWATSATNTGSRFAIKYRIGDGRWKTWKSGTRATEATFSDVEAGKRYTFRAKSMKGDDASKWSPVASITI